MLEFVKNYITTRNFTRGNNRDIKYIVIHYVGAYSNAYANARYFKSVYRGASAHYFVDENEIYRVVEDKDIAWHCGAKYYKHLHCRNSNSIGIEMCCFNNNGTMDVSEKVIERTIELTKELMKKYNIPITNVIRHYDVTGKACPKPFITNQSRWIDFKDELQSSLRDGSFKVGQKVLVNIPVVIAYQPSKESNQKSLVDSNNYQFWIMNSVIDNNRVYGLADIVRHEYDDVYYVKIFDDYFYCKSGYMSDKY